MWGRTSNAILAWLVGIALIFDAGIASARSYEDIMASGFIRVGVYRDFPPYSFMENGKARGIDVEIGQAIADSLNVELKLHWMLADENLDDDLRNNVWKGHYLGGGVADVMLRVPYDREFAYMTDPDGKVINDLVHLFGPYQRERWALAFDQQRLESVPNLAIFQYERIGVEIDSLPDFYLSAAFGGRLRNQVVHYPTLAEATVAMSEERLPAVMGMRAQVEWEVAKYQNGKDRRYLIPKVPFMGMSKQAWDIGMAVKDDHRQLGHLVSDVIDQMVTGGRMQSLFATYGLAYEKPDRYRLDNG